MSLFQRIKSSLRDDPIIQRVLRNSGYLFSSNVISAVLGFVQGILVVRLIENTGFSLLTVVMDFASGVNRLLSFRMSEVLVKYMGEALAQNNKERAAAIVKGIGITEALTSVLAYLVLLVLAVWGAQTFASDVSTAPLFRFYGLFLLANLVYETSVGVLQAVNNFKQVALANFYQSIVLTIIITAAFILHIFHLADWGITGILTAYLVGKTVAGFMITFFALRELNGRLGRDWTRAPLKLITNWKSILRFAFSTNLNGTVNQFARDNVRLYLAAILSTTGSIVGVGYFALASKLINMIMVPLEPFIWPTYAEITRTIAQRQWQSTRKLLNQVSTIASIWTLLAGGGLAAVGWWLIPFVYGNSMAPAYSCFLILLIGYTFANIMNWNRPLLLALGYPTYPLVVAAITGAIEIACIFLFVPRGGYLIGAVIFSAYLAISISINVWRGLSIIKREEAIA